MLPHGLSNLAPNNVSSAFTFPVVQTLLCGYSWAGCRGADERNSGPTQASIERDDGPDVRVECPTHDRTIVRRAPQCEADGWYGALTRVGSRALGEVKHFGVAPPVGGPGP